MTWLSAIRAAIAERDAMLAPVVRLMQAHEKLASRLQVAQTQASALEQTINALSNDGSVAPTQRGSTAGAPGAASSASVAALEADVAAKDRRIAVLMTDLVELHRTRNDNTQRELDLHRQVKTLETQLAALQKEVEILRGERQRAQEQIEMLTRALDKKERGFLTMCDELTALSLEYNAAEEKLRLKTQAYDELLERLLREKLAMADQVNKMNESFHGGKVAQGRAELAAAAESREFAGGVPLDLPTRGLTSVLPTKPLVIINPAHEGGVGRGVFSHQGNIYATGGADRLIKLWNHSGTATATLRGHQSAVLCCAFDAAGEWLLSGSADTTLQLWSLATHRTQHVLRSHTEKVLDVIFSTDSSKAYSCSQDHYVKVWDPKRGYCTQSVMCVSTAHALTTGPNDTLITAHFDKFIRVWDPRSGFKKPTFEIPTKHESGISSITTHASGMRVLTCCKDGTLRETDMYTHEEIACYRADGFRLSAAGSHANYSSDGQWCACGAVTGDLFIWNTLTGKLDRTLTGGHSGEVSSVSWSNRGTEVATTGKDGRVVYWGDI